MLDRDGEMRRKIESIAKEQGAEVIELKVISAGRGSILRCLVDYPQGGITLAECAAINKKVSAYLEEVKLLGQDYAVEINSPGLDRKLSRPKDFSRIKGRKVSLWLNQPVEGKQYWEGRVLEVDDDKLSLGCKDKVLKVGFNAVRVGKEKIEVRGGLQK